MFTNEMIEKNRLAVNAFADAFGRPECVKLNFETGELIEIFNYHPDIPCILRSEYIYSTEFPSDPT